MKTLSAVIVSCLIAASAFAAGPAKKWSGYLIDKQCANTIISKKLTPDKTLGKVKAHTKECALMEECVESGYGLWTDGKFIKFDKAGDTKASEFLSKTKKAKELTVTVTGEMKGDKMSVTGISE